jgi:tRNA (guanosine-2'-O-)-methyltransferase
LRLPWRYEADPLVAIEGLRGKGYQIVAVELTDDAAPYHQFEFADKVCLVVGHEDHGVTKVTLSACDAAVFVPMYGKGLSLNVHVALAVVLYHIRHCQQ